MEPNYKIIQADCLDVMRSMASDSVDSVITDPPAGIAFMGKRWDGDKGGRRQWIAWLAERMIEALRLLKPGHYAFVWALPRTSHWTATALEDAGFEVRDVITHVQGQGFPKSKALLKPSSEHWILCRKPGPLRELRIGECRVGTSKNTPASRSQKIQKACYGKMSTDPEGSDGFNPNLGRWPANFVLSHCGADSDGNGGCERVGTKQVKNPAGGVVDTGRRNNKVFGSENRPRANFAPYGTDGVEEVAAWTCAPGCPVALLDEQSGVQRSGGKAGGVYGSSRKPNNCYSEGLSGHTSPAFSDTGTASRFFHCFETNPFIYLAKASKSDRTAGGTVANNHPTVKSTVLMRHLIRLVAAPGDLVLDPFAGSGSTGVAALAEGCRFIGIEQDAESANIAMLRCAGTNPANKAGRVSAPDAQATPERIASIMAAGSCLSLNLDNGPDESVDET